MLLVRDSKPVLAQIDQVVDEVDRRPLQVAIEAMILSVKLDDSNKFGINFELLRDQNNIRIVSGTPTSSLATMDFDDGGLKIGFLDSSLSAFLDALETVGDANVIASPRLMCLNKQRAEIHIGPPDRLRQHHRHGKRRHAERGSFWIPARNCGFAPTSRRTA